MSKKLDEIIAWIDSHFDADTEPCPTCEGAGCSECDGTPLTDAEVEDQAA
jgi:hypothetical protein